MIIGLSGKINSGKDTVAAIIQYLIWKNKVEKGEKTNLHYTFKDFTNSKFGGNTLSNWEIKKFADKLKDILCLLLGCTREQMEDRVFKETELGPEWWYYKYNNILAPYIEDENLHFPYELSTLIKPTPRLLLQLIGTECGRQIIHPNIWINATMADYIPDEGYSYNVKPTGNIGFDGSIELKVLSEPEKYNNGYPNWIISDLRFKNELQAIKDRGGITIRVNRLNSTNQNGHTYINKKDRTHFSETDLDNATFDYIIDNNGTVEELVIKVKEILIKEKIL